MGAGRNEGRGVQECITNSVEPSPRGGWTTKVKGGELGPYHSRDLALLVAVSNALQFRKCGGQVRVVVKDARGEICAKRCLCARFGR
jgi:hypothetical protein